MIETHNLLKARSHIAFIVGLTIAATLAILLDTNLGLSRLKVLSQTFSEFNLVEFLLELRCQARKLFEWGCVV